jgi:very-short-patch-repair endonuclease
VQDSLTLSRQRLIQARARELLSSLTLSETRLWSCIRSRRLGVQFRRQAVLLNHYIVDFVAPAARVVVEVDGGYHVRRRGPDARRDEALRRDGYRVLRLEAELVMKDLARAVALVREALAGGAAR